MLDSQCCHEVKVSCFTMEGTQRALGNVIIAVEAHVESVCAPLNTYGPSEIV